MKIEDILTALAGHLRAMQLRYHQEHHLSKGFAFASDHQMFKDFYQEVESDYDAQVEHSIGLGFTGVADPVSQMESIHAVLELSLLDGEKQLCQLCDLVDKDPKCTEGFRRLLDDIRYQSEVRSYKLGRKGA